MAATGQGLLFIHGAGSRGLVWQLQLLAFPLATAPDLTGRTGGIDGYLEALRAELVTDGPRTLAGHSLGGAIALRWALKHPEEVRALILIGTGARLRVAPAFLEGIKAGDPAAVEQFGAAWFAPETPARLREKSLALLRTTPRSILLADLSAADGFDLRGEVGRLTLPALIMCGAEDRLAPAKCSQYLHEQIPGSEIVLVPGAGHMVMIEHPQATNSAIRAFLDRLDQEASR